LPSHIGERHGGPGPGASGVFELHPIRRSSGTCKADPGCPRCRSARPPCRRARTDIAVHGCRDPRFHSSGLPVSASRHARPGFEFVVSVGSKCLQTIERATDRDGRHRRLARRLILLMWLATGFLLPFSRKPHAVLSEFLISRIAGDEPAITCFRETILCSLVVVVVLRLHHGAAISEEPRWLSAPREAPGRADWKPIRCASDRD
jgi:hypothetical protein